MKTNKKEKNTNKTWIQYGLFAVIAITLYATGLHTEVLGFAQRGLLATGLMNPDGAEISELRNNENNDDTNTTLNLTKADFNLKLIDVEDTSRSLEELKARSYF